MYLRLSLKFAFFVFILVFFGIETMFAQDSSCLVVMEVRKHRSETLIKNARASAFNSVTKKVYKSGLRNGMPFFKALPEGKYRITVSKNRYFRSADDFYVSCDEGADPLYIELYKGTPRKIVKLYKRQVRAMRLNVPTIKGEIDSDSFERNSDAKNDLGDDVGPPPPPPRPIKQRPPIPKRIIVGVVNGKALSLPKPEYPPAAKAAKIKGAVRVAVVVGKNGLVISASAISGHPLLRASSVAAARKAKFAPTRLSGQPVEVSGVIVYNYQ